MDRGELVDAYLEHWRHKQDALLWAFTEVDRRCNDLHEGLAITLALVEASPNVAALSYVAAGPVEILLVRHGAPAVSALEQEAKRSLKVRYALGGVDLDPGEAAYLPWQLLTEKYPRPSPNEIEF